MKFVDGVVLVQIIFVELFIQNQKKKVHHNQIIDEVERKKVDE
jgi:hypothetical protein